MPRRSIFANFIRKVMKSREQNKTKTFVFYAETEYLREFYSQSYEKSRAEQNNFFCLFKTDR